MSRENEHCDFFPISSTERSTLYDHKRMLTGIGCVKLILSYNSSLFRQTYKYPIHTGGHLP